MRTTQWIGIIFLAACGAGDRAASGPVVRDSAGITIVENAEPAWAEGEGWRVAPEPEVDIGSLDGDEAYQLFRVDHALRLSDGRIVAANGGTNELRYYGADGRHLRTAGRKGGGPGEFNRLGAVWRMPGDSILAFDWGGPRVSVFDPSGRFVRSSQVPRPIGRLADGTLVHIATEWPEGGPPSGPYRQTLAVVLRSPDGAVLDTIARLPGSDVHMTMEEMGARRVIMNRGIPFGRLQAVAVSGDRIYASAGDAHEVTVLGRDGAVLRRIRRLEPNRPVTPADIEAFREHRLAGADDEDARRRIERYLAEASFPATMPAHDKLIVDAEGRLWVREYAPPVEREDRPREWAVFDPDGRWLGMVETPPRLTVKEIGADYVLGVWRDQLDVEHVRLHRLERPAGT